MFSPEAKPGSKGPQQALQTVLTPSPVEAAQFIRRGEVVAFPTETVYGLGADVFDEAAVGKIFQAKGRPTDNPLIVHIAAVDQLRELVAHLPETAARLVEAFFPGPLTLVLDKGPNVPLAATAGLQTVGIRMPRHDVARAFLKACGVPVAAPSANLSGRPSPTTWQAVHADLNGRIACILQGDLADVGLESTVLDCTGSAPVVLRAGAVTLEQLRGVAPETRPFEPGAPALPRSPGLKYKHYAPRAQVVVVQRPEDAVASTEAAYIGLDEPPRAAGLKQVQRCSSVAEYARLLFHFFRQCDAAGVTVIFCQAVEEAGLGVALMDRIKRAAHA